MFSFADITDGTACIQPFNWKYNPTGGLYDIVNTTISMNNTYMGGIYQQASSVVTAVGTS